MFREGQEVSHGGLVLRGCFFGGPEGVCLGGDELAGAEGMVECCVLFAVCFFAGVVQDGCGDGDAVLAFLGGDALHFEQVAGEVDYGAGVAQEAALALADGGVVFAGGGGGHGPEAGGGGIEGGAHEGGDVLVLDEGDFGIELCFHEK